METKQSIVRLHANITVNGKDWEVFKKMVEHVQDIVQAEGDNVLTHQTYCQSESFNCLIIEAYKNEEAFLTHLQNIKPLSEKYKVDLTVNRMELSGGYSEGVMLLMKEASNGGDFKFYDVRM